MWLVHDPQPAEFDGLDERQTEVRHQDSADRRVIATTGRKVETKAGPYEVSPVGEANSEVEVGALIRHAREPTADRPARPSAESMTVHVLFRRPGTDRILGQRRADSLGECSCGMGDGSPYQRQLGVFGEQTLG